MEDGATDLFDPRRGYYKQLLADAKLSEATSFHRQRLLDIDADCESVEQALKLLRDKRGNCPADRLIFLQLSETFVALPRHESLKTLESRLELLGDEFKEELDLFKKMAEPLRIWREPASVYSGATVIDVPQTFCSLLCRTISEAPSSSGNPTGPSGFSSRGATN